MIEKKNLKIGDIASLAGVSKSTVSRVLNNRPYVDESTKKRVLEIIEETGFIPQTSAINLASGKTNVIGLLVPSLSSSYSLTVIQGVAEKIAQSSYELMLYTTGLSESVQQRILYKISKKTVDGLVVLLPRDSTEMEKQLHQSDIPIVLIDHQGIDTHMPSISVTNEKGGFDATEHLISLGHQTIGFITGVQDLGCSIERLEGHKFSLASHNIEYNPAYTAVGDFTEESGFLGAKSLLQAHPHISALFCANDDMAIGAMRAARQLSLRIPSQLSIVGFDDSMKASMAYPPLTTVKQPLFTMGEAAATLVKRLIDNEQVDNPNIVLNTELIIRGSCAKKRNDSKEGGI